jgi:hypothetical protein
VRRGFRNRNPFLRSCGATSLKIDPTDERGRTLQLAGAFARRQAGALTLSNAAFRCLSSYLDEEHIPGPFKPVPVSLIETVAYPECGRRRYRVNRVRRAGGSRHPCHGPFDGSRLQAPPGYVRRSQRPARTCDGSAAGMRAIADHAVAAMEIHWSWPCGNPLSKYGWKPNARVRTCHEPSVSWVRIK